MNPPPSVPAPLVSPRRRPLTLRAQFTLVIFLLAFLPNLVLTLSAGSAWPLESLVLWMALVGVLCALIGYFLSGALLRSLSRLAQEIRAGEIGGAHADDPAEIVALRGAFTGLVGRLGTEQQRRNAFIATLVHDLKTPLIATGHLTQALTTLPLPDAERREVGAQITQETERLLQLVQQMADAHRFEREDVQVRPAPTDLRALLDDVARRVQPRVQARGLTLVVTGHGHASVDRGVLERAVMNLLDNALRYARAHIELRVDTRGLSVLDDGPGLSAPLEDLAQPFNAQPTLIAGQQYTSGTAGLGLFIARRIAEAHGAQLTYHREPLSLPAVSRPASPSALPVPASFPDDVARSAFTVVLPEVQP